MVDFAVTARRHMNVICFAGPWRLEDEFLRAGYAILVAPYREAAHSGYCDASRDQRRCSIFHGIYGQVEKEEASLPRFTPSIYGLHCSKVEAFLEDARDAANTEAVGCPRSVIIHSIRISFSPPSLSSSIVAARSFLHIVAFDAHTFDSAAALRSYRRCRIFAVGRKIDGQTHAIRGVIGIIGSLFSLRRVFRRLRIIDTSGGDAEITLFRCALPGARPAFLELGTAYRGRQLSLEASSPSSSKSHFARSRNIAMLSLWARYDMLDAAAACPSFRVASI